MFEEELIRRGNKSVKIYLREGLSDNKLQILTDGERLKKVLINLMSNASNLLIKDTSNSATN